MPRFHFNVYDDLVAEDEDGCELPDLAAARTEAIKGARGLMAAELTRSGRIPLQHRIDVTDGAGKVLLTIPFGEVVAIER